MEQELQKEEIELSENDFPDVTSYLDNGNPTLRSPNSTYEISLLQTQETLNDIDSYSKFIHNAISQFRHTRVYKSYKSYLMSLGLDHCAYLHNVNSEMAELEMNHCILTLFDVALMISEHYIKTYGYVSTFHIVSALREEHSENRIPLIMMSKTVHQLYHNDELFYVHPKQIFGKWTSLLSKYRNGITPEICTKLLYYIRMALKDESNSTDNDMLVLANEIQNWSAKNYGSVIYTNNSNPFTFWNSNNSYCYIE